MSRLTPERLRIATLRRQFPRIRGRDQAAVERLFGRLGPIQSQVPRAPFLTLASRLPGVTYATICTAFEDQALLKTSNIRGTVHTSTRTQFGWLAAVAARTREPSIRNHLKLHKVTPAAVMAEVERFCAEDWRPRPEIVAHIIGWLAEHEGPASVAAVSGLATESVLWGHGALVRRPRDRAWDRRTDIFHRTARAMITDGAIPVSTADEALVEMVRVHLGGYGPATRRDIAWWLGEQLTRVDAAVDRLGDELTRSPGPDGLSYLDLAEPPAGGPADPGLRLLPEFDGLLLGYAPAARDRFVDPNHLDRLWARANGLFSPMVLVDGRIVATWKTRTAGGRVDLEVIMLPGHRALSEDLFCDQISSLETALDLRITDLRLQADPL